MTAALADLLHQARQERNLPLEALADAAHMHRTSISLIEKGRRGVTIAAAARLSAAMGLRLSDLIRAAEDQIQRSL